LPFNTVNEFHDCGLPQSTRFGLPQANAARPRGAFKANEESLHQHADKRGRLFEPSCPDGASCHVPHGSAIPDADAAGYYNAPGMPQ
jgi:hypothetical protein